MMLDHLGYKDASGDIVRAIEEVLVYKEYRTGDLGGNANTKNCGAAILDAL
jgi:tartrate dehydrogenase/decarboxylase/D-malate dehydrogenase